MLDCPDVEGVVVELGNADGSVLFMDLELEFRAGHRGTGRRTNQ